jgi:D-methionine transport system permease protein
MPSLILSVTTATIGLIGATSMAGLVGGGGLGDLAYRYGFQRFQPEVMFITVIILILMVQGIQTLGNILSRISRTPFGC